MKFTKKLVILAVLTLIALPAFAGGSKDSEDRLDTIKKAGKLVIGTSADYPPYEFHYVKDGKDIIGGFDMAIAAEIAKDMGVALEIKDMQFDGLLAALQAGAIDLVISGMSPTEERRKSVDFSSIYYYATHGAIIRKGEEAKYSTVEGLKSGKLSAQKGTIQVGIAKTQILGMSEEEADRSIDVVKEVGSIKNLIMDLKNGNVDAIIAELPVAEAYVKANAELALAAPTFTDDDGGSAIAVKRGNPALLDAVNAALDRLIKAKEIDRFFAEAQAIQEEQGL
ncbi:transporter substrate-binding domain-containing protein [Treponema sp. OttesenSCG-928-L16]|nr:transporter substrate-binding domain-containing protein [Treponema sp. OttesenSCG-928-L16]